MSVFSDCLEKIRIRRDLTNTQIAQICGLEKTVVHRWFSGQRLPSSWEKIEKNIESLHLSTDERFQLKKAYEQTMVGEENYQYYQKMIGILTTIQEEKEQKARKENGFIRRYSIKKPPDFMVLKNKMEVIQCMQDFCTYLSTCGKKRLYLKMQTACSELLMLVKMFCYQNPDCSLEEIIYMDNELDGSYIYNASVFQEVISLLMLQNSAKIYFSEAMESDKKFAMNWIFSDYFFIEFNEQMSYGIVTTDPELLQFYQDDFKRLKALCRPIGQKYVKPLEYIEEYVFFKSDLVTIEYMPCFGKCLSEDMLRACIYEDVPEREQFIQKVLKIFQGKNNEKFAEHIDTFFFPSGLLKYMETGTLEIFPYKIYRPMDLSMRCEVLRRAIALLENGTVVQHMLRENKFPNMSGIQVDQIHGKVKKLTFTIRFEGEVKEQFEITEQRILNRFWQFLNYLKDSEYVYTVEETKEYMKKVLERYEKQRKHGFE